MKPQTEKPVALDGTEVAAINAALSFSTVQCIESMTHPDPKQRRGVDFGCIDAGIGAAKRLIAALGPDTLVPGRHGDTARGLLAHVEGVAELAAPYRPKERRA